MDNQQLSCLKENLNAKSQKVKSIQSLAIPNMKYFAYVCDPRTKFQINQIEKVQRKYTRSTSQFYAIIQVQYPI